MPGNGKPHNTGKIAVKVYDHRCDGKPVKGKDCSGSKPEKKERY